MSEPRDEAGRRTRQTRPTRPLSEPGQGAPSAGLSSVHSVLSRRPHRYPALFSMMLGAVGLLFVLIFAMHTESSTESGHLWWKKTTTTDIPVGERLPLLVVGLVLISAAGLLAWSAFRKFKLQDNNVAAVAGATSVRQKRAAARAIAERDPQMARDLRIGRPDLPRDYDDGGLVDLNTASTEALVTWLDLSIAQAARIVAVRQELGRFQHHDDLLTLAELDQHTFDRISARVLVL